MTRGEGRGVGPPEPRSGRNGQRQAQAAPDHGRKTATDALVARTEHDPRLAVDLAEVMLVEMLLARGHVHIQRQRPRPECGCRSTRRGFRLPERLSSGWFLAVARYGGVEGSRRHFEKIAAQADVQSAKAESQPTTGAAAPVRGSLLPPPPAVSNSTSEQVTLLKTAAQIHLTRLHRPDQAIPVLERAAQLVPQDRELLLTLCDAYNAAQRGRDAAQVLEKVIASFGSRRTKEVALYHHRLARALTQLGDKNVALTQLDMAFKIDPSSVGVLRDLGVLAFETNDLERAQRTFRALLLQRLDANAGISKGEVFCYLGEISAKQGDRAKALQMFERAIENDPALERARTKLSELKG